MVLRSICGRQSWDLAGSRLYTHLILLLILHNTHFRSFNILCSFLEHLLSPFKFCGHYIKTYVYMPKCGLSGLRHQHPNQGNIWELTASFLFNNSAKQITLYPKPTSPRTGRLGSRLSEDFANLRSPSSPCHVSHHALRAGPTNPPHSPRIRNPQHQSLLPSLPPPAFLTNSRNSATWH